MKKLLGFVLLLFMTAGVSFAQAGFGTLAGTVTDTSGAVVPHATVTLTAPDGIERTAKTGTAGDYQFTALPVVGGYSLTVTASGFATAKVSGLATSVGTVINQNITLQPGSENQTITVTAAAVEQVQTDTSSVSQLVDSTIWKDSPLETRTQNDFVYLTAGAARSGDVTGGTGRGAAVNGTRSGTGNFLVEGMDNNDQGQGGAGSTLSTPGKGGGAVTTISPDAIQEYRVISHNPSAEYGRAGGFATDTSLKSGTNHWHGSLFEYNRIQALAAEHFFTNYYHQKDSLIRNQYGGSVGGPIHKDTTYFFATVEIHRLRQAAPTGVVSVVTPDFLNFIDSGQFEAFQESSPQGLCITATGAACPGAFNRAGHLGSVFKQLQAAEPNAFPTSTANTSQANSGTCLTEQNCAQGLYTAGLTYPVPEFGLLSKVQPTPTDQERATLKIDQKLTDRDQLSFTYLLDRENTTTPFGGGAATFGPDLAQVGGSQLFTGNWTRTFSPSLQNVFRLGYTRHVSNFAVPNSAGVPEIASDNDPLGSSFGAADNLPQLFTENEFLYEDALTKTVGNHTLKSGFRFIRTRNGSSFFADVNGTVLPWDTESLLTDETFDDQADLVLYGAPTNGSIADASAAVDTTTGQVPDVYRGYRANEFAAYFQDDWKATSRLTLNLGLRWEYFGPPHNFQPGFDSNVYFGAFGSPTPNGNPFLPNTPLVGAIQGATFIQKNSNIWNKDTNNFGPRFGFSYDPTGKGKIAIRGGFGIGFDRLYNNVYENIRFNSPRYADNTIGVGAGSSVVAGALEQPDLLNLPFNANGLFAAYGAKPVPRHIDQRLVTAYYEQTNLGVEYEIAHGYVFEANYVGTFGRKLVGLEDVNNYPGRTACTSLTPACQAAGFTKVVTARPNLLFNGDNFRTNGFSSNYSGLQLSVRKSFSEGLMFLANYTYSKAMDVTSDVFTVKGGQTGISNPIDPKYDYGPADFDVRNMATITLNYESQWRKKNLLLGGWGISPIISMSSGSPFSVYSSKGTYNPIADGVHSSVNRVPYAGKGTQKDAIHHNVNLAKGGYLLASDFPLYTCPATINHGLWCEPPVGRNSFYGPSDYNVDLGVSKRFQIMESQQLTFQTSFFNLFNHANFNNPVSDLNNTGQFGQSTQTADPRIVQMSLRYDF